MSGTQDQAARAVDDGNVSSAPAATSPGHSFGAVPKISSPSSTERPDGVPFVAQPGSLPSGAGTQSAQSVSEVNIDAAYWSKFPVLMPEMNAFARTSRSPRPRRPLPLPTSMPLENSVSHTDWFKQRARERESPSVPVPVPDLDPMRPGLLDELSNMQVMFSDAKFLVIGRKRE